MGSPAMKFYWVNKNLMKFKDTILMYSKGDKDLILTPRGLVESVLNLAHNVPSGGGGGGGGQSGSKINCTEKGNCGIEIIKQINLRTIFGGGY